MTTLLQRITSPETLSRLHDERSILLADAASFNRRTLQDRGWVVVPVQSGFHFDTGDAERLSAALAPVTTEVHAVLAEALRHATPGYVFPPTPHGFSQFSAECGLFAYLITSLHLRTEFAILCTVDDYYLVAGKAPIVTAAVGGSLDDAFDSFDEFTSDEEWPESVRKHLLTVSQLCRSISAGRGA